jgi:Rrf2 family transcriptional regulator, iron-sulfur cluster assembly transcription factor
LDDGVRLELTRKTDLAVKALCALEGKQRVKGSALAESIDSTPGFLAQVLMPLVDQGWVGSVPGPSGGYQLSTELTDITIHQVIEAIEGPTVNGRCVLDSGPCPHSEICALHEPWQRARSALVAELAATTVASVAGVAGHRRPVRS